LRVHPKVSARPFAHMKLAHGPLLARRKASSTMPSWSSRTMVATSAKPSQAPCWPKWLRPCSVMCQALWTVMFISSFSIGGVQRVWLKRRAASSSSAKLRTESACFMQNRNSSLLRRPIGMTGCGGGALGSTVAAPSAQDWQPLQVVEPALHEGIGAARAAARRRHDEAVAEHVEREADAIGMSKLARQFGAGPKPELHVAAHRRDLVELAVAHDEPDGERCDAPRRIPRLPGVEHVADASVLLVARRFVGLAT
jgi:hypothetical protein